MASISIRISASGEIELDVETSSGQLAEFYSADQLEEEASPIEDTSGFAADDGDDEGPVLDEGAVP